MANGGWKLMVALALGNKVVVRKRDGGLAIEDEIVEGYKDAMETASFVRLALSPLNATNNVTISNTVETRILELTALHFVPISSGNTLRYKRAKDVQEGDKMLVQALPASRRKALGDHGSLALRATATFPWYVVTNILQATKQGLYKLFTPSGIIIVNGMVASTHSAWFLDGAFELLNAVHLVPAAYHVILLPMRMLYYVLGKEIYIPLHLWTLDVSELLSGRPALLMPDSDQRLDRHKMYHSHR